MNAPAKISPHYPPKYKPKIFLEMVRDSVGFLSNCPQDYPDILRFQLLNHKAYVIHNPDFIKYVLQENSKNYKKGEAYETLALLLGNGLINSGGEFWKRQRRLAQPAFHRESLERISQIVVDSTLEMLKRWKKLEGQTINFTREMAALTIEIVSKALFTSDVNKEDINTVWQCVNNLNDMAIRKIRNPLAPPFWFPTYKYLKAKRDINRLNEIVYGIIRKRKQGKAGTPDLLSLLTEAIDEDTGEGMTEEQLRDEVMTIFLAGHETTVTSLSWTWWLLKKHPEIEAHLIREAKEKLNGKLPDFSSQAFLQYSKCVINESLRLYPPIYAIGRSLLNEDEIGGYHVPLNTRILINIIGLHHHPLYWERPKEFIPERFINFDSKGEKRFHYIPFGAGPRICIGNNFALMEMLLINTLLAQCVEMELVSKNVKPVPQITLKPEGGVIVKLLAVKL